MKNNLIYAEMVKVLWYVTKFQLGILNMKIWNLDKKLTHGSKSTKLPLHINYLRAPMYFANKFKMK